MDKKTIQALARNYIRLLTEDEAVREVHWGLKHRRAFLAWVNEINRMSLNDLDEFQKFLKTTDEDETAGFREQLDAIAPEDVTSNGGGPGNL